MKLESLTTGVTALQNNLRPHFADNVSPLLYDYDFFTRLETYVKKQREKAKELCIKHSDKDENTTGVHITTPTMTFELSISKPTLAFDLDTFIDAVVKHYPDVPKWRLKELSTESVKEGGVRRTYSVKPRDGDE